MWSCRWARPPPSAFPYRNPWNRPKSFGLVSPDENVLRPRDGGALVTIPPNGVEYLRLYFPAVHRRGMPPLRQPRSTTQSEEGPPFARRLSPTCAPREIT